MARQLDTALVLVALAGAGCGDPGSGGTTTPGDPPPGCEDAERDEALRDEEVEHVCGHLAEGPFGELVAGEAIDNLHMIYAVTLQPQEGGLFVGELEFVPRKTGTHVFYSFTAADVGYSDPDGEVCVAATIEGLPCATDARIQLLDLVDGAELTLSLSAPTETVQILVERR